MANDPKYIPENGKAGVAFAGVELKEAYLLIFGGIAGLFSGIKFGPEFYLGIPIASYIINKSWLSWKKAQLPGFFRSWLFAKGWFGYSDALNKQSKVFIGDNKPINPESAKMIVDKIIKGKKNES
ncbi:hypothetical protein HA052_21680 [Chromobacterium haemolyticum]|uniref:PrgI family protein n=1 Tax=Chromobacterium fluminis TaxID=3044269 RepID=A0ABX0LAJ5_9NEIS|nr:hypothetical protein [Chromobacterium haemolyticum]NHR07805.1 hypothetical protein [Chromobacterium haemolyticum]